MYPFIIKNQHPRCKKVQGWKSLVLIVFPLGKETKLLANANSWSLTLGITSSAKQYLAVIHEFKILQDLPFAQVTRDLSTQGHAHSDIRWLSKRKVSSAKKSYSSIVVTFAKKALHQQLIDSSEIYLDGQWHTMCTFNYHRPPKTRAENTHTGFMTVLT